MRATITLPNELASAAKELSGGRPFSEFVRDAVARRVDELRRIRLADAMREGYRHEAESPSLDPEWQAIETEGWP